MNSIKVFTLLLLTILFGCKENTVNIRPITIDVVDTVSKKPIKDILIYRIIETYTVNDRLLFFIPRADPILTINVNKVSKFRTDNYGEIRLKAENVIFKKNNEKVYSETILVNMDARTTNAGCWGYNKKVLKNDEDRIVQFLKKEDVYDHDCLKFDNRRYRGFLIESRFEKLPEDGYGRKKKYDILLNGQGLGKMNEKISIELSRLN